jgi:hypothetical protein
MLAAPIIATIRTAIPALVGVVLAWLVAQGFDVPTDLGAEWTAALIAALTTGYYLLVTLLERRVWGGFGWLLGWATPPEYQSQTDTRRAA